MPRARGQPQPAELAPDLLARGVPRERAALAVRVALLRIGKGWNRAQLAEAAGIHAKQVEGVETGGRDPAFSTVVKLSKALDVRSFDELLGELPLALLA